MAAILDCQDTVLERVPYKQFFNRLGRFLLKLHSAKSETDPLRPFKGGVSSPAGQTFTYAHLDVVKCATELPWGALPAGDRQSLVDNCSEYLIEQLNAQPRVGLVLLNGRTALSHCRAILTERFGFAPAKVVLDMGQTTCQVWVGELITTGGSVRVVGWSSNVVNQRLRASAVESLAIQLREACLARC